MDYLVCRKAPASPEGCTFFVGGYSVAKSRQQRVLIATTSLFRTGAQLYDEATARLVAGMLNDFGPAAGLPGAEPWRALPAAVSFPATPVGKGA
ncbi:hypothetical protein ACI7CM_13575 [Xanthobacter sp. AM33]|uniref:hypothetical protein n=1 Tax=Xanthobacter sp. AM33 TaxID=3380644 RepID=UPI0039BFFB5B